MASEESHFSEEPNQNPNFYHSSDHEARYAECLRLKEKGNAKFKDNLFLNAIELYSQAIEICPTEKSIELSILFNNRAAAYYYLNDENENLEKCLADCDKAISLNETYFKPFLRRAQVYRKMGKEKLDSALQDYQKVVELNPSHREAQEAIPILKEMITQRNEELKAEMLGKLKDMGNFVLNKFGLSTDNFKMEKNPETGGYSINFKR